MLQTGKADCGSVEDACAALGERLEAVGRQLAPLPPLVGSNSSSLQQLLARFDMLEPRGDKTCAQLAEAQAVLQKFAKELLETRGQSAAQQQLLQGLIGSERASANPNPALTTTLTPTLTPTLTQTQTRTLTSTPTLTLTSTSTLPLPVPLPQPLPLPVPVPLSRRVAAW